MARQAAPATARMASTSAGVAGTHRRSRCGAGRWSTRGTSTPRVYGAWTRVVTGELARTARTMAGHAADRRATGLSPPPTSWASSPAGTGSRWSGRRCTGWSTKPIRNDPRSSWSPKRRPGARAAVPRGPASAEGRTVVEIEKDGSAVAPARGWRGGAVPGCRRGAAGGGRPDDRRDARPARTSSTRPRSSTGRWRGHADFLLRREPRAGRAGQRVRGLALRGRGHQARAPREGLARSSRSARTWSS